MQKILNYLIKNNSPYKGNIILKFEKYPHYTTTGKDGNYNSTLLNLGFIKLVSRFRAKKIFIKDEPGELLTEFVGGSFQREIDVEKLCLIDKYVGGVIGDHSFGGLDNLDHILSNSLMHKNGRYIGDLERAWWYYKNNFVVTDTKPCGVAKQIKKEYYHHLYNRDHHVEGFYGYTHRGGCLFKIGDRVFDENYIPTLDELLKPEFKKIIKKAKKSDLDECETERLVSCMPFKMRGSEVIETLEQAEQAAINLSNYLS